MVALDDPSVSSGSSSSSTIKFYRTLESINVEHTVAQVFDILSGSIFAHLFGTADANSRGLELATFFGKDARSGESVRNEERNCAILKWGKAVKYFKEVYNVTFKLYQKNMIISTKIRQESS
jgi:hypothetical protein